MRFDHPIFLESIRFIQSRLDDTGLDPWQQKVLERLIHSSGDFSLQTLLKFSPGACDSGLLALQEGASILTDTSMAYAAVKPMALRTTKRASSTIQSEYSYPFLNFSCKGKPKVSLLSLKVLEDGKNFLGAILS